MYGVTGRHFALEGLGGSIDGRRSLLLRRVREEQCGLLKPRLVGRLNGSGIRFQQSVFERRACLGPGQQIVAAGEGRELGQEAVPQIGRLRGD